MSNQCGHGYLRRSCEICQRDEEIEQLKAERDALLAERDAAVKLLREINERFIYKGRGSTHWEGCEELHVDCAMAKRIKAAIDAARGEK